MTCDDEMGDHCRDDVRSPDFSEGETWGFGLRGR